MVTRISTTSVFLSIYSEDWAQSLTFMVCTKSMLAGLGRTRSEYSAWWNLAYPSFPTLFSHVALGLTSIKLCRGQHDGSWPCSHVGTWAVCLNDAESTRTLCL